MTAVTHPLSQSQQAWQTRLDEEHSLYDLINSRLLQYPLGEGWSIFTAPNFHASEKRGLDNCSGMAISLPSGTPLATVIRFLGEAQAPYTFIGRRSIYVCDSLKPTEVDAYVQRMKALLTTDLQTPSKSTNTINYSFYDSSKANHSLYHKQFASGTSVLQSHNAFVMGSHGNASVGLYKTVLNQDNSVKEVLAIVVQNHYCTENLKQLLKQSLSPEGTSITLKHLISNPSYNESIEKGDQMNDTFANFLHAECWKAATTKTSPRSTVVLGAEVKERYNIVSYDEVTDQCTWYDNCVCLGPLKQTGKTAMSSPLDILLGLGPSKGFVWFYSKERHAKPLHLSKNIHALLWPLGLRKAGMPSFSDGLARGTSRSPKVSNSNVTWFSIGPNPYAEPDMYEEWNTSNPLHKAIQYLGLDYSNANSTILKPLIVYTSSPNFLQATSHPHKKHLPLKTWLAYKVDASDDTVWIPQSHPFLRFYFFDLYNSKRHSLGSPFHKIVEPDPTRDGWCIKKNQLKILMQDCNVDVDKELQ